MQRHRASVVLETTALILYIGSVITISVFHEPWFDEAQAWLIARDNSIFDILWHILRYEGHTPLWYLFLYIPAHMGIPFEFGLKFVNLVFASLAALMLVKKSPFPLAVRLFLPFTYFTFYQYGVISRSYSLLSFILWLVAAAFPSRNRNPVKFSLLLALLGGVTVHGMLIAFGIAVAWFIETIFQHFANVGSFIRMPGLLAADRRFRALMLLGLINILYTAILWPMPDKLTPLQSGNFNTGDFLFRSFIAPLNSIVSDVWPGVSSYSAVTLVYLFFAGFVLTAVFFVWALNRGIFPYVVLPYTCTTLFMSLIYFTMNHSGIYMLMIIFLIWLGVNSDKPFRIPVWARKTEMLFSNIVRNRVVRKFLIACISGIFVLQVYWSLSASINDIKAPYVAARNLAGFIQDNEISEMKIFNSYSIWDNKISYSEQNIAPLAYFTKNIFYNQNYGKENATFIEHKKYNDEEVLRYLRNAGKPDFVIEYENPISLYSDILLPSDYIPVTQFQNTYIWKNWTKQKMCRLYIRKDLLPQFPHLKPVEIN